MTLNPTTRTGKGSELTWAELDANFTSVAAAVNFLMPKTVAFATAIPFTGNLFMPQQTVTGALAFTVGASPQLGARTYLRLAANGANIPTFAGMKEWGGSAGYDNRVNIVNEIEFWYDGNDYWYFINQAVGATAVDTTAPTVLSAAVTTATPTTVSILVSESLDAAYVPAAAAFTISGHGVTGVSIVGKIINLTVSEAFTYGELARTVSYTQPGSGQARDSAGNLLASFASLAIANNVAAAATVPAQVTGLTLGTASQNSQPLTWTAPDNGGSAITDYLVQWAVSGSGSWTAFSDGTSTSTSATVIGLIASTSYDYRVAAVNAVGTGAYSSAATGSTSASATLPGAPTAVVATQGDTSASVAFTAPSNGGSAITGYTVTSTPGGFTGSGASSPVTVNGLTNGTAYTFTVTATNGFGTGAASSASNSVTPSAPVYLRFTALNSMTESGSGPYSYYAEAGPPYYTKGGVLNAVLPSGVDGSFAVTNAANEFILGVTNSATVVNFASLAACVWTGAAGATYGVFSTGSAGTVVNSVVTQLNDIVRLRRSGTTLIAEVARAATPTVFTEIYTWYDFPTAQTGFEVNTVGAIITNLTGVNLV